MNVLHTPPGVSHVAEMTVNPQKTGKSVNLNDLTTIELKEVLKGEGLSDKGKVKADFVERLRKHAVELGDENYTFVLRKYPQFVKRTTPIMNNDGNEGDGESKNRGNIELVLMMMSQLIQQILESQAQMVQMVNKCMSQYPMANIPSPLAEKRVQFDQSAPTICEGEGRNEGTQTGNVGEQRVTLTTSRNVSNDHTGRQPAYDRGFDNGVAEMGMRRSRVGNVNHDIANNNEMGNESGECSESEGPNGVGSETSDGSDNNACEWITKSNRRKNRKGKRETKVVVFSDPFLSVTKFNSKDLTPPFREWYNTEYHPVALQVGLSDRESCKRMRSHLDYVAKQAYDLAVEQYGFDLYRFVIICVPGLRQRKS